jgi:nucleoside-diphosphate kinase
MKPLSAYLKNPATKQLEIPKEVLVVIKPGFLDKSSQIIDKFARAGFVFKQMRTKQLTMGEAKRLYYVHKDEDFYYRLCKYMVSGPCLGIIFDASGISDPFKITDELKDKIRDQFGEDDMRNCLHSSDNVENMKKEMSVFF